MKKYRSITSMLALVLLFTVAVATAADAPKLTFKFTTKNVPGALQTITHAINNAGVTVGNYQDTSGVWHSYVLNGKKLITLDDPNGQPGTTNAYGITYNGPIVVVGAYTNSAGASVGFLYKGGKFTDIPGPAGAISCEAFGINDNKAIVGDYTDSSRNVHGFLLKNGTYTTLDVSGAQQTLAWRINNKGRIVLTNWPPPVHTSIYNVKTKAYNKIKDVPGAVNSIGWGLNNEDDIAFYWEEASGKGHGALCLKCAKNRKYRKFDYPKAVWTDCTGINDKQTIVGTYQTKTNGPSSGYKATFE